MSLVICRTTEIPPFTPFVFYRGEEDFFAITTTAPQRLIFEFDDGRIIHGDVYSGYYYTLYKCEFAWKKSTRCIIKNGLTGGVLTFSEDMYVYFLEVAK